MTLSITAEDRFGILDLYSRYSWTLDTVDLEGHLANYIPEGVIGMGVRTWQGYDAMRIYLEEMFARDTWAGSQHYMGQLMFLDGDGTRCRLKAYSMIVYKLRYGAVHHRYLGIYRDIVVKVGDQWLFEERMWQNWDPDRILEYRD